MAGARLVEVPDEAALETVELILRKHSKQGDANVVNLIFTGNRLRDLLALENLTTRPHYGIRGNLGMGLDAKTEIRDLLTGGHTRVSVDLRYPWGDFPVYLSSPTSTKRGSLIFDFDSPSEGWFLQGLLAGLMPILGIEEPVTCSLPEGGELTVTSFGSASRREALYLLFHPHEAARVSQFLGELIGRLDPPSQAHVILHGSLKTVRELHESGKIVPCGRCCIWNFEYVELAADESDVDSTRLEEVAAFLARRSGRERALMFSNFTWSWEDGFEPKTVNEVAWRIPKRGLGRISVSWFDDDPPPRGAVSALRKDMERFLAERNAVHGG